MVQKSNSKFAEALKNLSKDEQSVVNGTIRSKDRMINRLKSDNKSMTDRLAVRNRRLATSPTLAITEPIHTSTGKTQQVNLFEILNSKEYELIKELVEPILKVVSAALNGSDVSHRSIYRERDENGKLTNRPVLNSDGQQTYLPSRLDHLNSYYKTILQDEDVVKALKKARLAIWQHKFTTLTEYGDSIKNPLQPKVYPTPDEQRLMDLNISNPKKQDDLSLDL